MSAFGSEFYLVIINIKTSKIYKAFRSTLNQTWFFLLEIRLNVTIMKYKIVVIYKIQ